MNFNVKTALFGWPVVLFNSWRLRAYASKYKKYPEQYTPQQRNDWLLKKAKFILWLFNIKVKVEGYENLPKGPVILTPNHKSYLDPVILLVALAKNTRDKSVMNKIPTFLSKSEVADKKLANAALSMLDTVLIDRANFREAIKKLNEFGDFVKNNRTYGVIFPEGTRVKDKKELGEFKAGAFNVAKSKYLGIVPVAISDAREALNRKRKEKLTITVKFLPAIKPSKIIALETKSLAEIVKKQIESEI